MSMMPSNEVIESDLSRRAITLVYALFLLFVAFSTAWYLFYLLLLT